MGATRKTLVFLLAVILLIAALPYIVPLNVFVTDGLEQTVSAKLKRRVSIADVSFAYQPYPTLILENVQFGPAGQDGSVSTIELQVDLLTIFSNAKRLRKFVLNEATFTQTFLQQIPDLLKPGASTTTSSYTARLIEVRRGTIKTDKKSYGPVEAEVMLNPDQSFQKVVLHNPQRSVELQISPLKNAYAVALTAKNWEAPFGPKPMVESLVIDAETQGNSLLAREVNGRVAGGSFKGTALLDWTNGWAFSGRIHVDDMDGDAVSRWFSPRSNFTGSLNGDIEISSSSDVFDTLFLNPSVKMNFDSVNGTLNNFDFITPIRTNTGTGGKRGGSTKYDSMSGSLAYAGDHISLSGLRLKSGLLNVSASMNVLKNKLSGSAHVSLGNGVNRRSMSLRISGEFDSPLLIPPSQAGGESSVTVITQ